MDTTAAQRIPVLLLQVLAIAGMVTCLAVAGWGFVLMADDAARQGEWLDGVGLVIGLFVLGAAATVLVVLGWLWWQLACKPVAGLWSTVLIAGFVMGAMLILRFGQISGGGTAPPWGVGAWVVGGAAVVLLLAGWGLVTSSSEARTS